MKGFLFSIITILLILHGHSQLMAQQDCFDAISVCSNNYVQNNSYSGVGSMQEIPIGSTCLGNGEMNSAWYTFTASTTGNMLFQLTPLNLTDDYDFALFNLTNDSCSGIVAGLAQPVSCNYSSDPGPTGSSSGGSGNSNGSSGPNQNAPISVQAGDTYALLVSNFTSSQSGYSLDFAGNASIGDNASPQMDSVDLGQICNPEKVVIYFDEDIDCSTISNDGSEITVTGPSAITVLDVTGLACADGRTDRIRIRFTNQIQTVGTYTITISSGSDGNSYTDACGNEIPNGTSITFNVAFIGPDLSIINIVDASCGQSDGSAEASLSGGTQPYTYNWYNASPPQNTAIATGLTPGTYRITVTDANGCIERGIAIVSNNSPMDISNTSVLPVSCNGASDGTAQVIPSGGISPYIITWDSDPVQYGQTAFNIPGGNIDVTVTDLNGCSALTTLTVPEPQQITLNAMTVNPDCGTSNGGASVSPSGGNGGFSYSWDTSPPVSTSDIANQSAGVYSVTVTDQNNCQASSVIILVDNFAPNATITSSTPDCGQGVGSATAQAISGNAPFSYQWNTTPPQTTANATGLDHGDYYVTVTDVNGCVQIINVKIDSVPPPQVSVSPSSADCGQSNGSALANVVDGIDPYSFSWSSSSNTSAIETGLAAGTYSVTVTDSIGCTDTQQFAVDQLAPISDFSFQDVCDGESMTFVPESTSGATTWTWSFGDATNSDQQNPTHLYNSTGQYEVTVIFAGGCMNDTVTLTVNVFAPPTSEFNVNPEILTTRVPANFNYSGNGGTEFDWGFGDGSSGTGNSPSHLYPEEGFYDIHLMVTDPNGCTDTTMQTIEVLLQPDIFLPNAFMPQGISENARFKGYGVGITAAELSVFDRWGTMLYRSSSLNDVLNLGWDGTFKGKDAPIGVYTYMVKADFYNNTSFEKLGTVTLLR